MLLRAGLMRSCRIYQMGEDDFAPVQSQVFEGSQNGLGDYLRPLIIFKFKYLERLSGGESELPPIDMSSSSH